MFLGACLDLGLPREALQDAVERLGLPGVAIAARKARRGGFVGTRFQVHEHGRPIEGPDPDQESAESAGTERAPAHAPAHDPAHTAAHGRDLAAIRDLIGRSALSTAVKERALQLFARLAEAEARAHGTAVERVHFHEVGAVDSIVDLVGAATALELLQPERLTCGPINVGGGTAWTEHGQLPVPAPATAELVRGLPIYGSAHGELLTPTGAVLLCELVDEFTELPALRIQGLGYGLGRREIPGLPNAVRLTRGEAADGARAASVEVVECEIDDLPGEGFGFLLERLLGAGALDVYFTPVQMKKNRPGTLVTLLCRREQLEPLAALLLAESGSLGCRHHAAGRFEAERETFHVETPFGVVAVKRARFGGRTFAEVPEYEDCRRLALASGVPWREVYGAAIAAVAAVAARSREERR